MKTFNKKPIKSEGEYTVLFNESNYSFSLVKENLEIGYIVTHVDDLQIWLNHVYIDPDYRGKKLGELLVFGALSYLKEKKINVIPVCSYAKMLINRNVKK